MLHSAAPAPVGSGSGQLIQALFALIIVVLFFNYASPWMHRYASLPLGLFTLSSLLRGGRLS